MFYIVQVNTTFQVEAENEEEAIKEAANFTNLWKSAIKVIDTLPADYYRRLIQ